MPRTPDRPFQRWLGTTILRLGGWKLEGEIPDIPRAVVIAAPHSSNWDGLWGLAIKLAMQVDARVLGKAQLFWWPLGPMLRAMGVIPLNRAAAQGTVGQAVDILNKSERMWFALAPEGTRKPVKQWKGGFIKIARLAGVPIIPAYWHYPDKVMGFGPPFHTTGDDEADMAAIRQWYRSYQGKNRGTG